MSNPHAIPGTQHAPRSAHGHAVSPVQRVLRLDRNRHGRDFVVGDIHGAFSLLDEALRLAHFNPHTDRLLSVGDLIDRGAESYKALQFLDRPYVHAVRGNHEAFFCNRQIAVLRFLAGQNYNGLEWISKIDDDALEAMQQRFATLPTVIEVQTEIGTIGLLHADVPRGMHWSDFTQRIEGGCQETTRIALSGRRRLRTFDTSGVHGVARVYVGHSVCLEGPLELGNVRAIDTGAAYAGQSATPVDQRARGFLTVANIVSDRTLLAIPYLQEPSTQWSAPSRLAVHSISVAYERLGGLNWEDSGLTSLGKERDAAKAST